MIGSFKQGWWAPLAVLISVWDVFVGVALMVDQQNPGSIVGGVVHMLAGVGVLVGLKIRSEGAVWPGTVLIGFGALGGSLLVWLVLPPVVGLAVLIGAVTSATGNAHPPRRATSPS